ncbi:MAG TPA: WD40 repeat domain-containing serine/threonine-protein kinase [Ktedonobacteraceae bacterium]|nr:WD40 repeat domain-containing serine/threonine-protein kinase [Ktedonobacteraceae bacterium]
MVLSSPFYCDGCGAANRSQAAFCFACGQPLHRQSGKHSSTTTGLLVSNHLLKLRYRILQQIGKGGFGAVYKAADLQFGNRLVAIKEMSQNSLSVQELAEATAAFNREAMLLASLTHPNLPRIYEQFTDMGRWYLVMDFIEGETLEEYLDKMSGKKLPIEKVLEIGVQLCMVLEYLHLRQPPIIFRDLKPANIMLTPHGHVYLIDFGIARHFKPGQAKDTTALGSSGYAAPEQYGRTQTTPRADIYGLGATLHQMLSGNDPSDSPFHFASLQLLNHPILARLEALIMRMLEMDADKRPASIAIVRQELQSIGTQYLVSRTHPLPSNVPTGYQPPKPSQVPAMPKLAKRTALPQVQGNTRFICTGHSSRVTAVAWSPRGTHVASASYDKTVRIWDAANGNSVLIFRGHWDRVQAVAWSPDGMRIASGGNDGTVQVWDALTGNPIYTYRGHTQAVSAIAWSLDSRRIASASEDKTVQVWDAFTGTNIFTHRSHNGGVQAVVWSPDGRRIASGGEDKTVQVWSPVKDKNSFFTNLLAAARGQFSYKGHAQRVNALMWSPDGSRIASVSADRSMQVWDSVTGRKYFVHHNPSAAINTVCWSPDSRYLASGSNDKSIQIWDAGTRHSRSTYRGHTGYVTAVAWSPDGKLLASGSVDHTVQVWQAF